MGYDGSLKFDTSIATEGFNSGVTKLGSVAKSGMQVLGTAVASGVAAFGLLTKAALDSTASMEQNVGGIETLFGTGGKSLEEYAKSVGKSTQAAKKEYEQLIQAQNLALENANQAYKTAGLSANEYMETVTSFAASLKQSVKDETEAAKVANQAVIDMSDNANKMGTDMELIQNAYQGFAKQNYTMLDNLKLGYGGTKTEMERLLADAQKLTGIKYDINNLADVYEAIHVIQEDIGITGTTAKEAATTISGSMASAKAAFDNFLNGSISVEDFAESIGMAAGNIARNLGEIVPRLAESVPAATKAIFAELDTVFQENGAESIFAAGGKIITDFVSGFASEMPALIEGGTQLLSSFIENMGAQAPRLLESGLQIGNSLLSGIVQVGESLFTVGSDLLGQLASGISTSMPQVLDTAGEMVSQLIQTISENAPSVLETGTNLLASFLSGIGERLPELVPQGIALVTTLADGVVSNLPTIINAGIDCLAGLVEGIINSLPTLIEEGPRIINDFCDAIWGAVGRIITTGAELILELAVGLLQSIPTIVANADEIFMAIINVMSLSKMLSLGKNLIQNMATGIKNLLPTIKTAGKNVLENLVNGIKALASNPVNTLKSIANNAMKAIKGLDWKGIGSNIINGIIQGLKKGVSAIIKAAKDVAGAALSAAKKALGIKSPSRRFRDEVGKMMAEGMGIGFEDNVPVEEIKAKLLEMTKTMREKALEYSRNVKVQVSGFGDVDYPTDNLGSGGSGALLRKVEEAIAKMERSASEITQTVLANVSNKINESYPFNRTGNPDQDPEDSVVRIINEFYVDGKKLVDDTTEATIKKINSKNKDANAWKGVKNNETVYV